MLTGWLHCTWLSDESFSDHHPSSSPQFLWATMSHFPTDTWLRLLEGWSWMWDGGGSCIWATTTGQTEAGRSSQLFVVERRTEKDQEEEGIQCSSYLYARHLPWHSLDKNNTPLVLFGCLCQCWPSVNEVVLHPPAHSHHTPSMLLQLVGWAVCVLLISAPSSPWSQVALVLGHAPQLL